MTVAYLLVALGGAVGALARHAVALALPTSPAGWPWGTLAANLTGCLLMGLLLAVLAARRPGAERLRALLGTGVLGGFTTYSAFALETVALVDDGAPAAALAYVVLSVAGGVLAVAAGARAGVAVAGRP